MRRRFAFAQGFLTGSALQLALGPVFFFTVQSALNGGWPSGLAAAAGATLVDALFIALALGGLGALLEKPALRPWMAWLGPGALIAFGIFGLAGLGPWPGWSEGVAAGPAQSWLPAPAWDPESAFGQSVLLTASSPLTIVFWSGVFSARSTELGLRGPELWLFALGALVTTLLSLGGASLAAAPWGGRIPPGAIWGLNGAVALGLMAFGLARAWAAWGAVKEASRGLS